MRNGSGAVFQPQKRYPTARVPENLVLARRKCAIAAIPALRRCARAALNPGERRTPVAGIPPFLTPARLRRNCGTPDSALLAEQAWVARPVSRCIPFGLAVRVFRPQFGRAADIGAVH